MTARSSSSLVKLPTGREYSADLTNLIRRHKLPYGHPADLNELGAALASNPALRNDLFSLCTAISHMAAEDLSPQSLLLLVARAIAGREIQPDDQPLDIPEHLASTFVDGFEEWSNRKSGLDTVLPWPTSQSANSASESALDQPRQEAHPFSRAVAMSQNALQDESLQRPADARHIRRLRITILALACLLLVSIASASYLAHTYLQITRARASALGQTPAIPAQPPPSRSQPVEPQSTEPAKTVLVPSSIMMMSRAISTPSPSFPTTNSIHQGSTIDIEARIAKDGHVTEARVMRGNPGMGPAALSAVRTWRFTPYERDGHTVEVISVFTFEFQG